ncbi:MAG: DNA alkylation repair protein [Cyanobacteria bacterium SZAS-4]|nr:DNA alkylation repair protein [Cyanobacteria bacterium SZAS-4]
MPHQSLDQRIVKFVQSQFKALADPVNAVPMAAYMKTEMPFYGIPKPLRIPVYKTLKKEYAPTSQEEYEACVLALWNLPHREEKYAAIEYAMFFDKFITYKSLSLYERLVREGQWWDFVDPIAIALVGIALKKDRARLEPKMNKWIDDDNMWIRRTAILSQNRHKADTNEEVLFEHCLQRAHEKEFFIRKAIGWALREYSYAAPNAVRKFLDKNQNVLSPLSLKEGAKQLERKAKS